jgi:hypothetical protein
LLLSGEVVWPSEIPLGWSWNGCMMTPSEAPRMASCDVVSYHY